MRAFLLSLALVLALAALVRGRPDARDTRAVRDSLPQAPGDAEQMTEPEFLFLVELLKSLDKGSNKMAKRASWWEKVKGIFHTMTTKDPNYQKPKITYDSYKKWHNIKGGF